VTSAEVWASADHLSCSSAPNVSGTQAFWTADRIMIERLPSA
jgi:hypothetical protein